MYICVCQAITNSQIVEAAQGGASSVKDLRKQLNLGSDCGQCADAARQCLSAARQQLEGSHAAPASLCKRQLAA